MENQIIDSGNLNSNVGYNPEPERKSKKFVIMIVVAIVLLVVVVLVWWKFFRSASVTSPTTVNEQKILVQEKQWKDNLNQIASVDKDFDNLTDVEEKKYGTNPNNPDTDKDGILDGDEIAIHKTNPLKADTDGDGRSDGREIMGGTDPLKK